FLLAEKTLQRGHALAISRHREMDEVDKVRIRLAWVGELNRALLLAGGDVPELEEALVLAGDECLAVRGETQVADVPLFALERQGATQPPGPHVPEAD